MVDSDTPFNMAMLFYVELHKLRILKTQSLLSGNMEAYRDCLEEMYTQISFKIKKSDFDFEGEFAKANLLLKNYNPQVKSVLRMIDKNLILAMHKANMIFPKIEARGLAAVSKRYGLS